MKKFLYILITLSVIYIGWYCFTNRNTQKTSLSGEANVATELQPTTNLPEINPNFPTKVPRPAPPIETIESAVSLTNALTATNLEQWKAAISGLKKLGGFTLDQHWLMEQPGRKVGLPITLSLGDKTMQYSCVLISVNAKNETGNITEIEMQTPNMNIDETRQLGLQLCSMFGIDSANFVAWCDQVGNHWLDTPLFGSHDIHDPNSNAVFAFQTLRGYNDEKPWLINFMIIPNP